MGRAMATIEAQGWLWNIHTGIRQVERNEGTEDFPGRPILRLLRWFPRLIQQGQDLAV